MTLLIILQLDGEASPCHRVIRITFDARQLTVFNFKHHCASIGAIMRATVVMSGFICFSPYVDSLV